MTWRPSSPKTSHTIAEIPEICQDNFDAIEDALGVQHGTFTATAAPLSGVHKLGESSVVYVGTTSELDALSSPPTGALGFDTDKNLLKYHSGTGGFSAINSVDQDWSRVSAYRNAVQDLTDGTLATVQYNAEAWDDRGEFNTTNYRFTARASGHYWVHAQVSIVASSIDLYTTMSGVAYPTADLYTVCTASSGSDAWACLDGGDGDWIYKEADSTEIDYFSILSDNLPTDGAGLSCSSSAASYPQAYSCDDNNGTYWASSVVVCGGELVEDVYQWLIVDFGATAPKICGYATLKSRDPDTVRCRHFRIYASNTWAGGTPPDEGWTELISTELANDTTVQQFCLNNATPYRYYSLVIYSVRGTTARTCQIVEWQLLSPPWHIPPNSENINFIGSMRASANEDVGVFGVSSIVYLNQYILTSGGAGTYAFDTETINETAFETEYDDEGFIFEGTGAEVFSPASANAISGMALKCTDNNIWAFAATWITRANITCYWDPPAQSLELGIYKNGSLYNATKYLYWPLATSAAPTYHPQSFTITGLVYMIPNDYIEIKAKPNTHAGYTETITGDASLTFLTVTKVDGAGL